MIIVFTLITWVVCKVPMCEGQPRISSRLNKEYYMTLSCSMRATTSSELPKHGTCVESFTASSSNRDVNSTNTSWYSFKGLSPCSALLSDILAFSNSSFHLSLNLQSLALNCMVPASMTPSESLCASSVNTVKLWRRWNNSFDTPWVERARSTLSSPL